VNRTWKIILALLAAWIFLLALYYLAFGRSGS
jgi:hypothetical protein